MSKERLHTHLTTDPDDPRLAHGSDESPVSQSPVYLVLSDEERAKGFVRPLRRSYKHVGAPGPKYPLRDLTVEERERPGEDAVKIEEYPESERPGGIGIVSVAWRQKDLDATHGCGHITTMGYELAATYARQPNFYGSTYCATCSMHRPVGKEGEFIWIDPVTGQDTDERVGT